MIQKIILKTQAKEHKPGKLSPDFSKIGNTDREKKREEGKECEYCGTICSATADICPECGMSLHTGKCTFCGAPLAPDAEVCGRCGCSTEGEECPECGTINFRGVCRKCNTPVTPQSRAALQRFREDPKFKEAEKIAQNIEDLKEEISEIRNENTSEERRDNGLSRLKVVTKQAPVYEKANEKEKPKPKRLSLNEALAIYEKEKERMEELIDSIVPPPEFTPEEQRDFYSTRMYAVKKTFTRMVEKPTYWVCNYCGCRHKAPQECAEPWLGGKWEKELVEETYEDYSIEP